MVVILLKILVLVFTVATVVSGQTTEFVNLWQNLPTKSTDVKDNPGFEVFLAPKDKATGVGILVCPGGGYRRICSDHEGVKAAQWLNSKGISAFVLWYRLPVDGYKHPVPLNDARRAMQIIRYNASKWNLNPDKIGVMGFSAGAHLAAHVSTEFLDGEADATDLVATVSSRPDFSVLAYPCITTEDDYIYRGILDLINGTEYTKDDISLEKHVTQSTPPTFLVLAHNDGVHPMNSVLYYEACLKNKVPAELHIYQTGGHGFGFTAWPSMSGGSVVKRTWMFRMEDWLNTLPSVDSKK